MQNFVWKALAAVCLTLLMFQGYMNTTVCAQTVYIEPGDVILSINGQPIAGATDLLNAVNRSPQRMFFTVKDGRTGQIAEMYTTLNTQQGQRFGVSSQNATGGGAMITAVTPGGAARRCTLVRMAGGAAGRGATPIQTTSKIHILFVWGTKSQDTYWATTISKRKIEDAFKDGDAIGLPPNSPYIATFEVLEGDGAHPTKIIEACTRISNKAGANDAVLVYILCHGASVVEDGDTSGQRVHGLSPVCTDADNMNLRSIGIRRASILNAMKTRPHRLHMLVTDACSVLKGESFPDPSFEPEETGGISVLAKILLTAQGTLNINSANPTKGAMNQGELAMAWVPARQSGESEKEYLETLSGSTTAYSGTVFTNAFIEVAGKRIPASENYSLDKFFNELKSALADQYRATKEMAVETNASGMEMFMYQQTQTLTKFDDKGVAIP